jgi:hypothetical protein
VPFEYRIHHKRRLVEARGVGSVTNRDLVDYQRQVWTRAEVAGYDELIDMTRIKEIVAPSSERMLELAALSASMDGPPPGNRFAIVAPHDLAFGLGRMYQVYRGMDPQSTKQVGVFRTWRDALAFLEIEEPLEPWEEDSGNKRKQE